MAGHAQLKFVMTECSKTQIRLAGLNYSRLILFTKFPILRSNIISNQKCKLVTFHADTRKVIGRSKLLLPYEMPVLVMDYSTKHRCIQSALLSPRKINKRWCEMVVLHCNARFSILF